MSEFGFGGTITNVIALRIPKAPKGALENKNEQQEYKNEFELINKNEQFV